MRSILAILTTFALASSLSATINVAHGEPLTAEEERAWEQWKRQQDLPQQERWKQEDRAAREWEANWNYREAERRHRELLDELHQQRQHYNKD